MKINDIILLSFWILISCCHMKVIYTQNRNTIFSKLTNKNDFILDDSYLLSWFVSNTKHKCLSECTENYECNFAVFKKK